MITWQHANLFPLSCIPDVGNHLSLCYRLQGSGPKERCGKSNKESKVSSLSITLTKARVLQMKHTQNNLFACRIKFKPFNSFYKAFQKLVPTSSSSSVSITKVHIFCIPEISTGLQPPEYATLSHIFSPVYLLVPLPEPPSFLLVPPSDELLLILKESSHLYCHEPPKQPPTPFCVCQPSTYYLLHYCIYYTSL